MRAFFMMLIAYQALAVAKDNCEFEFEEFIYAFGRDEHFQMTSIQYPLSVSYLDMTADPEPRPVYHTLSQNQVDKNFKGIFPIDLLEYDKKVEQQGSVAIMILRRPDVGERLVYTFSFVSGCWILIRFDDEST